MLRRLAIRPKLFFVVAAPIAFLLFAMAVSLGTLNRVKIQGPEYQKINELDQLRLDVSPPTQYLGRSYGEVQSLLNEVNPDEQVRITERLDVLEKAYMEQHAYWEKTLPEGEYRTLLVETSYEPAAEFWKYADEIGTKLTAGDRPGAVAIAQGPLKVAFLEHEAAIIRLADLAEQQRSAVEVNAGNMVKSQSLFMLGMFLAVITATGALGSMVARAIQRPISQLQAAASDAVEALSGADVDAGHIPDIAPVVVDSEDEAAAAATSFNSLLATTMELLRKQARMRRNNTEMFINLGRRNQNLVSRQLKFIDSLERSETDPELLASLFRLDHLATRMRRNAESLLVLAGLESPRKWRNPVPALEVARSAASEAEQFERIEFGGFDELLISGTAVANVVHLLAELLDNAVRYSPPDTVVTVSGVTVGDSLVITIADLGMGMSDQDLAAANARLASMQDLDEVPTAHLGLFVVARLAARHGIAVRLDSRGGEGLTALVALPPTILADVSGKPRTKGATPDSGGMSPLPMGNASLSPESPVASKGGKVMARPSGDDDGRPIKPRRKKGGEPAPTPEPAYAGGAQQDAYPPLGSDGHAANGGYPGGSSVAGQGAPNGQPMGAPSMAAAMLPEAPATPVAAPLEAPVEAGAGKSGGALGRFQPRRRKGGAAEDTTGAAQDITGAAVAAEPPVAGVAFGAAPVAPPPDVAPLPTRGVTPVPSEAALTHTAPALLTPPVATPPPGAPPPGAPPLPERVSAGVADAAPVADPALSQLVAGRALPGAELPEIDGPAYGPAAPAFGVGGVFGAVEARPIAPAADAPWRDVELPTAADLPASAAPLELPARPVRNNAQAAGTAQAVTPLAPERPAAETVVPTTAPVAETVAAPPAVTPPAPVIAAKIVVDGIAPPAEIVASRYAALPRANKPTDGAPDVAMPSRPSAQPAPADASDAEVPLPGRPRTPVLPTRMPSVGLAGGTDESPFTGDAATPKLPARPEGSPAVAPPPPVRRTTAATKAGLVPPPPAVSTKPATAASVPASGAPALPGKPAAPVPAAAAGTAAPAVPAPPALPDPPAMPARLPGERGQASPPAVAPPPPMPAPVGVPEPATAGQGANADDPTTPSGLRKRVRQEPAVAFNRFAQQEDINVRKSRSPEAMKDRLMSFTAGKSAAKTTDPSDPASSEAEPQFVSRTDQVQDSPSTNPPPKS